MHASDTPLSLPPDPTAVLTYTLPEFIQERTSTAETITSDILSASLHSMELFHEKSGKEIVVVSFSHHNVDYVLHITGASAVHDGWLHHLSFFTTTHRLERNVVRIFRDATQNGPSVNLSPVKASCGSSSSLVGIAGKEQNSNPVCDQL